jgi:hypothetical protein
MLNLAMKSITTQCFHPAFLMTQAGCPKNLFEIRRFHRHNLRSLCTVGVQALAWPAVDKRGTS